MSLLPIVTPRSSDTLQQQRLIRQVNADQTSLQSLYDQLSTGRRVLSGSEDPAAVARALGLSSGIALSEQQARNAQATASFLQTADTALGSIDQSLIEARGAAVAAAQNVLPPEERGALVQEIDQVISRVVNLSNQAFQDTPVFGGVLTTKTPLLRELDGILYQGNETVARPSLGSNVKVETLPTGAEALGLASPAVKGDPLVTALTPDTRLVDMRDGRGIKPGLMRITDGSGWQDVDLTGSVTLGDIKERIEAMRFDGRALAFDIGSDSVTLRFADNLNATLGVDDAPGSSTSVQLNLSNPLALQAPPLVGGALGPRTTRLTLLADLNNGAGIDVSAGIRIEYGSETFDINLSTAKTVDDVLAAINRSGAAVRAELDPASGSIQLRLLKSGVEYSIGERGGLAATNLGIRSSDGDTTLSELLTEQGARVNPAGEDDLLIQRPDGTELNIDASGFTTVGEVINAINSHPANQDVRRITAELSPFGNGIRLWGPVDSEPIVVRQLGRSNLGNALGLIDEDASEQTGSVVGGLSVLQGRDPAPVEPTGTLDTLLRLREAVREGDQWGIERLTARLDGDFEQTVAARGDIGFRARNVDALKIEAEDQTVLMQARRSEEIDADLTEVISKISTRQAALEASLQLIGRTAGLTVLNFL